MIIIAFAHKSSKKIPNLICKKFKHVAPIILNKNKMQMLQFVRKNNIHKINLKMRDIKILKKHGWFFIFTNNNIPCDFQPNKAWSCVDLCKRALGIKQHWIQTPDALYRHLNTP